MFEKDYFSRARGNELNDRREVSRKRADSRDYGTSVVDRRGKRSKDYEKPPSGHKRY